MSGGIKIVPFQHFAPCLALGTAALDHRIEPCFVSYILDIKLLRLLFLYSVGPHYLFGSHWNIIEVQFDFKFAMEIIF